MKAHRYRVMSHLVVDAKDYDSLEEELKQLKYLYKLRGEALQRPCPQCGYKPLVITTTGE